MEFTDTAVAAKYTPLPATDCRIADLQAKYDGMLSKIDLATADIIYAKGDNGLLKLKTSKPAPAAASSKE